MGAFLSPPFPFRRSALILGVFEFLLQLPELPLNTSLSGFNASLALQALAASRAASSFLDSPLGFFESAFGFVPSGSFHIDLIQPATFQPIGNRNDAYFISRREPSHPLGCLGS